MDQMQTAERQVVDYWTKRAHDFGVVRQNELQDGISGRWLREMETYLPGSRTLDILDAGHGGDAPAGCVVYSDRHHLVADGIDHS